jgi:glycosyltransferase involved in cell wall biosynthesis
MSKIKMLIAPGDNSGSGKFRCIDPHVNLQNNFSEDFFIDIDHDIDFSNISFLKKYDAVFIHLNLLRQKNKEAISIINNLKKLDIKVIVDIDDHWELDPSHGYYQSAKLDNLFSISIECIKLADMVTTTTETLRNVIKVYNKNVVILPNAINPNEEQFKIKKTESDLIRFGWLGGSCMTPDTEILTNDGWKRFDELNKTETVATLNPKTNEVEYHKPNGYICEPFEGELNCAKNGLVEYEVTQNHNMYASIANSLTHKKLNLELIQSEKIHGKNFHVKRDGIWLGKEEEYFILPSLKEYSESFNEKPFKMDKWLEFFGFWMAEGWTSKTRGLYQVGIAQTKKNGSLNHMFNLLIELGFNPTYTKDKTQLRVFDKQLWYYLSYFGCANEKFIPKDILNLCERQLNIFLKWFIIGDGHIEKNKYERMRAFTSSPSLANDLQEIALKIGISATITNRGKRTTEIKGIKIKNQYDSLTVNFSKHPNISRHHKNTPLIKSEAQYNKYYKGNVYCVEVENHIIYVRRNGKPMWIGNSHIKDIELLSDFSAAQKSLPKKTQIVLCGFNPKGIVQTRNPQTGEIETTPMKPQESSWFMYELFLTNNYKNLENDPEYLKYLVSFIDDPNYNTTNKLYRRVWTKPITQYGTGYNQFDISLIPLNVSKFNSYKSQLKVIEAGFHKKAVIAQNYGPYTIDLINSVDKGGGWNNNGNALMVEPSKNHKQWFKYAKKLTENPNLITELGEKLYETVKEKYNLNNVTKNRSEYYKKLLK